MTIDDEAIAAVECHPAVRSVRLVGSRATGTPTPWSDWDFAVETDDFEEVARDLGSLLDALHPLAQQWDRLSETWCWMVIAPGPTKLDFIFAQPHEREPPWQPNAAALDAIDQHFWDWALWLRSKQAGGKSEVVTHELHKMYEHILGPMGVASPPSGLTDAVASYIAARDVLEQQMATSVPRKLEQEVRPAIIMHQ